MQRGLWRHRHTRPRRAMASTRTHAHAHAHADTLFLSGDVIRCMSCVMMKQASTDDVRHEIKTRRDMSHPTFSYNLCCRMTHDEDRVLVQTILSKTFPGVCFLPSNTHAHARERARARAREHANTRTLTCTLVHKHAHTQTTRAGLRERLRAPAPAGARATIRAGGRPCCS